MLCQNCRKRNNCKRPCSALHNHLREFNFYEREIPLDPAILDLIFVDPEAETTPQELNIQEMLVMLTPMQRKIIISHFLKGHSFHRLAGQLKIPVGQLKKLCRSALETMKEGALMKNSKSKPHLSSCQKDGYNIAATNRSCQKPSQTKMQDAERGPGRELPGHLQSQCKSNSNLPQTRRRKKWWK
jgi:hypothetical protein